MPPGVPQLEWVQYGSFGLVTFAVTVLIPTGFYGAWKIFNRLLDGHERVTAKMAATFEAESRACREERLQTSEKDRVARHDLANSFQKLSGILEVFLDRQTS